MDKFKRSNFHKFIIQLRKSTTTSCVPSIIWRRHHYDLTWRSLEDLCFLGRISNPQVQRSGVCLRFDRNCKLKPLVIFKGMRDPRIVKETVTVAMRLLLCERRVELTRPAALIGLVVPSRTTTNNVYLFEIPAA